MERRRASRDVPGLHNLTDDNRIDIAAQEMACQARDAVVALAFAAAVTGQLPPFGHISAGAVRWLGDDGHQPGRRIGERLRAVDAPFIALAGWMDRWRHQDIAAIAAHIDAGCNLAC